MRISKTYGGGNEMYKTTQVDCLGCADEIAIISETEEATRHVQDSSYITIDASKNDTTKDRLQQDKDIVGSDNTRRHSVNFK